MFKERTDYIFWTSYRRKMIDALLRKNLALFHGIVLDIGGRDRGRFQKPKNQVERWIFADINPTHHPDLLLDVANMHAVQTKSIDVISACELFEHVKRVDAGLRECHRVLKPSGLLIITVPFLYPIHADPYDYQRWTEDKWRETLEEIGFSIETCIVMGRFFTVVADELKMLIRSFSKPIRWILAPLIPCFSLLVWLDYSSFVAHRPRLKNYHGGYFILARKIPSYET
ncbi:methyltransferase domain-containing protein [Patescibacteria group bacterium]|nr:MAG: methyltransferase domain-containing protein [Patescibacteria group bacterium]